MKISDKFVCESLKSFQVAFVEKLEGFEGNLEEKSKKSEV